LPAHAKKYFYTDKLNISSGDQRELFKCVNDLLNKSKSSTLPTHSSKEELANDLAEYFMDKVRKIRQSLEEIQTGEEPAQETSISPTSLHHLELTTDDEVRNIIMSSSSTTCASDPIPTSLLKDCIELLLPTITQIINSSLTEAEVPDSFKLAIIKPLLKKETLDPDIFKHYRPI
jgi:hypothetical protein